MDVPDITEEEKEALVHALADALDVMVAQTCNGMGPLWIDATSRARAEFGLGRVSDLGFVPSPRLLELGKSSQSKYRALAAWRHAVVWQEALDAAEPRERRAVEAIYFSPYPDDAPPWAWSRSAEGAPGCEALGGPERAKRLAARGCAALVTALRRRREEARARGRPRDEAEAALLWAGVRHTIDDVLKLTDHERRRG